MTRPAQLQITTWGRFRRDLRRSGQAYLRQHGPFRELVLPQIRAGVDPSPEDIAGALREAPPEVDAIARVTLTPKEQANLLDDPPVDMLSWMRAHISEDRWTAARAQARQAIATDTAILADYVATVYVERSRQRTIGRKTGSRTLEEDNRIALDYFREEARAQDALTANSRLPRAVKAAAKRRIAAKHRISTRTLERIISGLRANIFRH